MLVIFDDATVQGYTVLNYGATDRRLARKCGLELIVENPEESLQDGVRP